MKSIGIALLAILTLSSLRGQPEDDSTRDDDPFGMSSGWAEYSAADKAKGTKELQELLVPSFNAQVANPNVRFTTDNGQDLISFRTEGDAARLRELLKELKDSLTPNAETECEDWVRIWTPEFDARESKVFILYPEQPKDDQSPFYGIRIYNKAGDITELCFSSRVAASKWVQLIEELQAQIIKKRAEQASAEQPATRPESKSKGSDKPQPEAEGRSR